MFKNFHEIRTLAWISYSTLVRMWLEKGLVSQKHRAGIWSGSPLFGFEKRGTGPEDPIHDVLTGKLPEDTLGDPAACLWGPSRIVRKTGQGWRMKKECCHGAAAAPKDATAQRCVASCWLMYRKCKDNHIQPSSVSFLHSWLTPVLLLTSVPLGPFYP